MKISESSLFLFLLFFSISLSAFKIDRVIISTDMNSMYKDFWPVVAEAWKKIVGIKPTLAFIAPKDAYIDESIGDVIRFEPIPGISTALQAQVIRLLLPLYFEDEVCLISDMDMLPLSKSFFIDNVVDAPDDSFVVYRSAAILRWNQYPMCYNAAKGKTYKEIFGLTGIDDITNCIKRLAQEFGHVWSTDQMALFQYLKRWPDFKTRCILLGHTVEVPDKTISRAQWHYDVQKLKRGGYIDAHMLRPYSKYKDHIDRLAGYLGLFQDEC